MIRAALMIALVVVTFGCRTTLNGEGFESEWGGSQVVTVEIDRRTITATDGTVTVEEGISETTATAHGLSENLKGLAAAIVGFLLGGA